MLPASVPLTYAAFELGSGHCVQAASPALEKVFAGHVPQTALLVGEQAVDGKEPPAQTAQDVQGARPVELQLTPATHRATQVLLAVFQA